jgi:hypothetical protein
MYCRKKLFEYNKKRGGIKLKKIIKILCIALFMDIIFLSLEFFTNFEINNKKLYLCLCAILLIGIIIIMIIKIFNYKEAKILNNNFIKIFISIFRNTILLIIFLFGLRCILFVKEPWKTQKIVAINKNSRNKFIEWQIQDIGNLGYRNRTVEILYITKHLIITRNIFEDQDIRNMDEWERIDIEINEMDFDGRH